MAVQCHGGQHPGAGSVHSPHQLVAETSGSSFVWGLTFPASGQARRPQGRKTPLTSLCQLLKVCHGRPQVSSPRLRKGVPVGPRLRGTSSAREALERSDRLEAGVGRRRARTGRITIPGRTRTRTAWGRGGARLPEGLQRKGERVALREPTHAP